ASGSSSIVRAMSGPYVYKPPTTPTRYAADFQNTPYYVHTPKSVGTPFIPDATLYPSSPYTNSAPLPASPKHPSGALPGPQTPRRYVFPYETDYSDAWVPYQRERRPSYHGPGNDQWLQEPPAYPPVGADFRRRHSFGASGYPQPPAVQRAPSQSSVNPWINGEAPRPDFFFDLSLPTFSPMRTYASGQSVVFPYEDMIQPAFIPSTTRLRIVCDAFPQWPIVLQLSSYEGAGYDPLPISVSDVLVAVHRSMHKQITHDDWRRLSRPQEIEVARAFTRRVHADPDLLQEEHRKGVKRVDYLLGKTRMAGLMNLGRSDGWDVMQLVVT
ncbi:hypothetical protein DXG03_004827, partial [Asterophora parasitica]